MEEPATQRVKKKMDPDFFGLEFSLPPAPWLDIRVFYVRISCCSSEDVPETLAIRYGPRPMASKFEVNGNAISAADDTVLILRQDRVDSESSEATYVGTDRLRTTGSLCFEICQNEEPLICGVMQNSNGWPGGQGIDRIGAVGTLNKSYKAGWVMECRCAISSPACIFLKRLGDGVNVSMSSPLMEVYVAGRYSGAPVILTQTVELVIRRKLGHRNTLDSIPEVEELERSSSNPTLAELASQVGECSYYQELDNKGAELLGPYRQDGFMEGEDGEITWFNAGVRVGMGLGLGMCVGIGIGVGLLMRAYQSTTRTLRRRFF